MTVQAIVDVSGLNGALRKLSKNQQKNVLAAAQEVAKTIIGEAKKNAPKGFFGNLKKSGFVRKRNRNIRLGFDAPQARVMDIGFKKNVIKPLNPKGNLFIPLTARAARVGPRKRRPSAVRRRSPDFIFRKSVKTPKARFRKKKGPNRYFSGTINKLKKNGTLNRVFAANLDKEVKKTLGVRGPRVTI